jgi:hypothetical protein
VIWIYISYFGVGYFLRNRQNRVELAPAFVNRSNLFSVHSEFAAKMRQKLGVPEFVKLRMLAQRKQVQIAFFCNFLPAWEELARKIYGKPHCFFEHRQLIVETMKHSYLPQLEAFYGCSITHFYIFEAHYFDNIIYGFTAKLFSDPLFKDLDAHHAPLEEKLGNAFAARIRQQYGRGPAYTLVAFLDNRFLTFFVNGLLAPFHRRFVETDPSALDITTKMLKELIVDAVDFVCREHYGQTYETFVEIDLAGNQLVALVIVDPLTEQDFSFE